MKKLFLILSVLALLSLLSLTGCHAPKPVAPAAEESQIEVEGGLTVQEDDEEELTISRPGEAGSQEVFEDTGGSDVETTFEDDGAGMMIERTGKTEFGPTNVSLMIPSEQDANYPMGGIQSDDLPTTEIIQRMNSGQPSQMIEKPIGLQNLTPLAIMPHNYLDSGQTIQFGWGETSAVISGYIPAGGHVTYNLYAMLAQHFLAVVTSNNGSAVLGISDDRGTVFVDPNQRLTSYDLQLPRTATYYVDIYSTGAPTYFTFQVFIPARVNIPQGKYSTSLSGNIGPYGVVSYTAYIYAGQTIQIDDYSGSWPTSFLRVSGLDTGQVYLDYSQYSPSWYAVAPETQDYLIEVITLDKPSNYRLTVYVR